MCVVCLKLILAELGDRCDLWYSWHMGGNRKRATSRHSHCPSLPRASVGKSLASGKPAAQGGNCTVDQVSLQTRDKERRTLAPHILAGRQTGHVLLIPMILYQHTVPWDLPLPAELRSSRRMQSPVHTWPMVLAPWEEHEWMG